MAVITALLFGLIVFLILIVAWSFWEINKDAKKSLYPYGDITDRAYQPGAFRD